MADTVGEFLIKLGLDADNIDKQLNNVIDNVRGGLSNLMTGVVAPALAGLASGELVQQFADDITQVDKLSKSLGMSVEQLSAWRTAAEMAGVEANEVGEIFADFNDWMVDAKFNEGGAMYTDFIQNGLLPAVTDANGEMKKTEDYILEFADALHKMDPAQASGIARQIGLSDLQTASWIQQGGDAIRRQLELAKEIGTYTQEDAQAASEFTMSIKILTHSVRMMLLPVFRALVPILTNVSKLFTEASKHATALIPVLSGIGIAVGVRMAGGFLAVAKSIKTAALAARAFIFSPWGAVLMALLAIGLVLEDFLVWLDGGESAWGEYYEAIFGDTENAKKIFSGLYDTVVSIFNALGKAVDELSPHFAKLWEALGNLFNTITQSKAFEVFTNFALDVFGELLDALAEFIEYLAEGLTQAPTYFEEFIDTLAEIIDSITDFVNSVGNELEYLYNVIASVINTVIDIFDRLGKAVDMVSSVVTRDFTAIGESVSSVFIALGDVVNSVVEAIINIVLLLVDTINSGVDTIISLLNSLMEVVSTVGEVVSGIFNAMANAFNTLVSAVSSGASTIIGWITNILNKLAELASNSLLGKIVGSIGGGVSALFSGGGYGNTDNSSTVVNVTNNGVRGVEDLGNDGWSSIYKPAIGAFA